MLLSIMMPSKDDVTITHQTTLYKSESAVNAFLDFLAEYLMRGVIRTNKSVTFMILKRMATRYVSARDAEDRKNWQGQIIALLSALPRSSYDGDSVLKLVEESGIWCVCWFHVGLRNQMKTPKTSQTLSQCVTFNGQWCKAHNQWQ